MFLSFFVFLFGKTTCFFFPPFFFQRAWARFWWVGWPSTTGRCGGSLYGKVVDRKGIPTCWWFRNPIPNHRSVSQKWSSKLLQMDGCIVSRPYEVAAWKGIVTFFFVSGYLRIFSWNQGTFEDCWIMLFRGYPPTFQIQGGWIQFKLQEFVSAVFFFWGGPNHQNKPPQATCVWANFCWGGVSHFWRVEDLYEELDFVTEDSPQRRSESLADSSQRTSHESLWRQLFFGQQKS